MSLTVWAPHAHLVEVVLGDRRVPMTRKSDGHHTAEGLLRHGDRYLLSVDGGPARPDPRSRSQPDGVHDASEWIDPSTFEWHDGNWEGIDVRSAVIYELHIGTFTPEGTFDGAVDKLDHLVALGVDAVEVMPVAEFPGVRGWGYDGVDLYAPHHAYGGPSALVRFVDACHARGLAVILDVVYNHLGPAGNYLAEFGPYFTDKYHTPWGAAINFDGPDSDGVRRFFIDNALMWLRDYHFDGLRLDAVHAILDTSATHILESLVVAVDELHVRLGRELFLIAESDLNDPRVVRPRTIGGYGIDAQWSDDFHHALHSLLTAERDGYYADFGSLDAFAKALRQAFVYDGTYSPYRRRTHGRRPDGLGGHNFLAYLQNHDQIGNRALGERSTTLMSTRLLKVAAAFVFTSPFVPMLFQGEEWGATTPFQYFTDHEDPELGRAVSEGRRREFATFGWDPEEVPDPQAPETYERSKLDWDEARRAPHADLLEWHRALIALRRQTPELSDGRMDLVHTDHDEAAGTLVVRRGGVVLAANLSERPARLDVAITETLLESAAPALHEEEILTLAPHSVVIGRS